MESFDSDDYSLDSLTSDESNDSDFSFDSDEFPNEGQMDTGSMSESHTSDSGFTSTSHNDTAPIAVSEAFSRKKIST